MESSSIFNYEASQKNNDSLREDAFKTLYHLFMSCLFTCQRRP